MTIQVQLYDTATLLGLYRELEAPSSYFRDLCFGSVVTFDDEYIDFEKVSEKRKLAPLVVPTVQGRPIYEEASTLTRVKAAYLKPKDVVSPSRTIKRRPGENLFGPNTQTPGQRYNAIIGDILRHHRESIDRREEWMAARAIIDGKLTLEGEDYPTRVVDFQRAANHTVTLTGTNAWNNGSFAGSVLNDLNTWINRVRTAKFGGPVTRVTVGSAVLEYMLADADIKAQLDTQTRGTTANLNTGIREGDYVEYIGNLGPNIQLWVNSDYYELPNGSTEKFLDDGDIVLTGPNVMGVRAFGAIMDANANFQAIPVFPKMWSQEDPSATFVMSQSAPMTIPVNPNQTLKATVLE